jgi:hypothetical protein
LVGQTVINNLMAHMPPGERAAFANGAASRDGEVKKLRAELVVMRAEIKELKARLALIADIASGSTTANSLPHIARIAQGKE